MKCGVFYVYDGEGNIVRSIDIKAEKEYNYEYEEGRIIRATEADIELNGEIVTSKVIVNTVKYYYDTEGKMTKKVITPASGSAQTVYYETNDDSTTVKFSAGGRTVTSHSRSDSFGRKVFDELQLGTGFVSRQFAYHAGEVTDQHKESKKLKSSATTQLVSQIILSNGTTLSYGYDAEERITSVVETYTVDETPVTNTTLYTYDALGQLLTETVNGEVVNTMTYDNYGNIISKNGKQYCYDEIWQDLLTCYDGRSIQYDKQGNPVKYLGHTLTWEKGRQLKSFDGNTYTYNANGIRTSKTVDDVKHTYTLDGTKILRETWNGNTLIPLYDNEDGVCGILYNNVPYYFIKNLQGDIIAIVDKDAQTVARYSYDAWGVPEIKLDSSDCQIATINPFRYRSYYYDQEIGLYYLQSRYYDASVGRFVNGDDVVAFSSLYFADTTINLIAYCRNNPTTYKDENGYSFKDTIWALIKSIGSKVWSLIKHFWSAFAKPGKINLKPFGIIIDLLVGVVLPWLVKPLKVFSNVLTSYKAYNSKLVETAFKSVGTGLVAFLKKLGVKVALNTIFAFFVNNTIFKYMSRFLTIGGIICFVFDKSDGTIDYWWKYK